MSSDLLPFRFAAATIAGASHVQAGRNNQDAYALCFSPNGYAAVVCDGCGSQPRSEVGAQLGADLLAAQLIARAQKQELASAVREATDAVVEQLRTLAATFDAEREEWIESRMLFTVVGAVANRTHTAVFAFGDGVVAVNGEVTRLGPFEDNAPPYLSYRLLDAKIEPSFVDVRATADVRGIALGTDGLAELGDLGQLVAEDAFFLNRDSLRRKLWQRRKAGDVSDDATAILIRRWAEA